MLKYHFSEFIAVRTVCGRKFAILEEKCIRLTLLDFSGDDVDLLASLQAYTINHLASFRAAKT